MTKELIIDDTRYLKSQPAGSDLGLLYIHFLAPFLKFPVVPFP